ncbi:MAG: hydrolase [Planctomycetota bacterium]|jgi:nicotinamidase-related amidase
MLDLQNCWLVVVDVQGKLAQLMYEKQVLFKNIEILIKASKLLKVPILWVQQVPKALGETVGQIAELLTGIEPIDKSSFSCCGDEKFNKRLNGLQRQQVLICGIESHVCVYQTAVDLLKSGKEVTVIADAVSSRSSNNKEIAIDKLKCAGIDISSVEMVLFELLRSCEHPKFKEVAELIK